MNKPSLAYITTVDISLRYLLLEQMCSLQEAGYEVVGISTAGDDTATVTAAGIRHIAVPMSRKITPLADLLSLWRLYRVLRRERFTIVHTQTPKAGLLGQLAARMAGVPVVVNTVLGFYFHENMRPAGRRFYIVIEKIAARCSDLLLSQNREDIQTAIREGICPPGKIKYLGNGIDVRRFDPARVPAERVSACKAELGIAAGAPVAGFVGRLAEHKGFRDFLAAAKIVAAQLPDARFVVIGQPDHPKPDAVEPSAAADYGIADRCLFLGQVLNQELPLFLKTMDLLALPSQMEGMPQVVMEAASMGVPAVVTNVRGNREAVEHERNGLLVPLGDVPALATAMLDLLTDPAKARRLGEEGRRRALAEFDRQIIIERVKDVYVDLLTKKGLPLPSAPPAPVEIAR